MPGVIFDMDGVLVDSGAAHEQSWQILAKKHEVELSPERLRALFGQTSRDIIRQLWGPKVTDADIRQLDREKEAIYRELIAEHIPLKPGCRVTLERLEKAGYTLAVCTSGPPENLELVLSEGFIANYFEVLVNGFEVYRGKPAPDCFQLAVERLQMNAADCVVVEDAPVGVTAALAAQLRVIGLAGTHPGPKLSEAGAAELVSRLDEITPALVARVLNAAPRAAAAIPS
jgi:beta-phosphoglucomutase